MAVASKVGFRGDTLPSRADPVAPQPCFSSTSAARHAGMLPGHHVRLPGRAVPGLDARAVTGMVQEDPVMTGMVPDVPAVPAETIAQGGLATTRATGATVATAGPGAQVTITGMDRAEMMVRTEAIVRPILGHGQCAATNVRATLLIRGAVHHEEIIAPAFKK